MVQPQYVESGFLNDPWELSATATPLLTPLPIYKSRKYIFWVKPLTFVICCYSTMIKT